MPDDILIRVRELLRSAGIAFREVQHEPTRTSEKSARARGEELKVGGKALVLKVDDTFRLFVLSAARQLDSNAIKRHFAAKRQRFAQEGRIPWPVTAHGTALRNMHFSTGR